jgi:amino-acid N-acetyltransferase
MIRKATIKDIKSIHKILADYGSKGIMLPRPLSELYDHVRDFSIFEDPETKKTVGCCALQFCWEDLAEIRSLAVLPDNKKKKIGSRLVEAALKEARVFDIKSIFTLTYEPVFFKQFGFNTVDRATLPLKIWADCYMCIKFPDCDETAMMKTL